LNSLNNLGELYSERAGGVRVCSDVVAV
jgi:hypothetical protein